MNKKRKLTGGAKKGAPRPLQKAGEAMRKRAFLAALEKGLGIVLQASKATGIGRRTFYDWLKRDKEFAEAVEDVQETAIDFVESNLMQAVQSKSPGAVTAQIFFLKCRAKHRGYVEKVEVTGQDGRPMVFEILSNVPRPNYDQPREPKTNDPTKTEAVDQPPKDPEFKF